MKFTSLIALVGLTSAYEGPSFVHHIAAMAKAQADFQEKPFVTKLASMAISEKKKEANFVKGLFQMHQKLAAAAPKKGSFASHVALAAVEEAESSNLFVTNFVSNMHAAMEAVKPENMMSMAAAEEAEAKIKVTNFAKVLLQVKSHEHKNKAKLMKTLTKMAGAQKVEKTQAKEKLMNTFLNMAKSQKLMDAKDAQTLAAFKQYAGERKMINHLAHLTVQAKVEKKKIIKTLHTLAVAGKREDTKGKKKVINTLLNMAKMNKRQNTEKLQKFTNLLAQHTQALRYDEFELDAYKGFAAF